jgi:hypothetical protein
MVKVNDLGPVLLAFFSCATAATVPTVAATTNNRTALYKTEAEAIARVGLQYVHFCLPYQQTEKGAVGLREDIKFYTKDEAKLLPRVVDRGQDVDMWGWENINGGWRFYICSNTY